MTYSEILFDVDGGVATVTMNRPEIRNAMTSMAMIEELVDAFARVGADPALSVLILTGAGRAF